MTIPSGDVAGGNSAGLVAATSVLAVVLVVHHVRSQTAQTRPALAASCAQDIVVVMSAV